MGLIPDVLQYAVEARVDIVVRHAQFFPAGAPDVCRPPAIIGTLCLGPVRSSIDFDRQPQLAAGKVGNERADGVLAAEVQTIHASATQAVPEYAFCGGHLLAQGTCAVVGVVIGHAPRSAEGA